MRFPHLSAVRRLLLHQTRNRELEAIHWLRQNLPHAGLLSPTFRPFISSNSEKTNVNNTSNRHGPLKPIVIIGGGPTGLFMAHMLQSYQNVPFILLEKQLPSERFQHPQAHFLNTRSMEIFKHSGFHSSKLYDKIRRAMPPVEEWKHFIFGPKMIVTKDTLMAKVVHPVDRPLLANTDANGRLVNDDKDDESRSSSNIQLSEVSVGHLAQHTFCQILHDTVMKTEETSNRKNKNQILYGHHVTDCNWNESTREWTFQTEQGETFQTSIVIAADGAHSFIRKDVLKILTNGQSVIQNLINVHFQVSKSCEDKIPKAMLYTVFSPTVLAMIVRHGPSDYVMQIPYFAPYQTPENDFTKEKVQEMVRAALGGDNEDNDYSNEFTIRSIRPWTMGSLVAQEYFADRGVFLVGDAAHVFPPAGGFGMNTGLQDVYSLAWRLSLFYHEQQSSSETSSRKARLSSIGRLYQQERQPIARQNAALSVRNYRRVLNVMQACYLNHKHPEALIATLDATSSLVPLTIRQRAFQTCLQAALLPLGQLDSSPHGIYSKHVKENLRTLLHEGEGLPLLFPKHEIDFSYSVSLNVTGRYSQEGHEESDWKQDSLTSSPRLAVGALFPHMPVRINDKVLQRYPCLLPIDGSETDTISSVQWDNISLRTISTRDLASQMTTPDTPCAFCILEIVNTSNAASNASDILISLAKQLQYVFQVPFLQARLVVTTKDKLGEVSNEEDSSSSIKPLTMFVDDKQWNGIEISSDRRGFKPADPKIYVVIRPDGHVASISDEGDVDKMVSDTFAILENR